jgi:hypothetical protein
MASATATRTTLLVGDHVMLRGTRIVGDVTCVEAASDRLRIVLRVTDVIGKSRTSKTGRAWRGAWVTCIPDIVVPQN